MTEQATAADDVTEQTLILSEVEYVAMRGAMLTAIAVLNAVGNHLDARGYEEVLGRIDGRWDAEYEARRAVATCDVCGEDEHTPEQLADCIDSALGPGRQEEE